LLLSIVTVLAESAVGVNVGFTYVPYVGDAGSASYPPVTPNSKVSVPVPMIASCLSWPAPARDWACARLDVYVVVAGIALVPVATVITSLPTCALTAPNVSSLASELAEA
jgi:hypothetical protein